MAGFGGFGSFAGGFAQTFNSSMHQQQELQLERQRMQQQQQRETMARANTQRAELSKIISEQARALLDAGGDPKDVMRTMDKPITVLERMTKSLGMDPNLVRMEFGMMLSRPSSYDVERGGQRQTAQGGSGQTQQSPQGQPNPSAFDQGASPQPYVQGDMGGEGYNTTGPPQPAAPQTAAPQQQQLPPEVSSVLDEKIDRTFRALQLAENPRRAKELEMKASDLMRQRSGKKNVHSYKSEDGTGVNIVDTESGKAKFIPFPEHSGATTVTEDRAQGDPTLHGMPPLTPGQTATLGEIGPKEFDFLATRYAFGDKSVLSGAGRGDRKSRAFNKALQGRAADFWMAKGMGPEDAMKAQLEFGGMAKGSQVIAQLDARMTVAIEKARATAPVVLDAAKKINRTDFPAMNELILNWDEHTGDPNVPPFFIALETLANNYGSALGMGNSVLTDSRVQHARDLIKRSWASGQLESGIGQMLNELNREQKATRQSMHVFLSSSNLGGEKKSQETLTDDDLDNMSIEELQELRKRGR